jgi:hypothetical protein
MPCFELKMTFLNLPTGISHQPRFHMNLSRSLKSKSPSEGEEWLPAQTIMILTLDQNQTLCQCQFTLTAHSQVCSSEKLRNLPKATQLKLSATIPSTRHLLCVWYLLVSFLIPLEGLEGRQTNSFTSLWLFSSGL